MLMIETVILIQTVVLGINTMLIMVMCYKLLKWVKADAEKDRR